MAGQLRYDVFPEDVLGGAWVDELGRFVPVRPGEKIIDDEWPHILWEYHSEPTLDEPEGPVRAGLLFVPAGSISPAWHIIEGAGDGLYYEGEMYVAGRGLLLHQHKIPGGEKPIVSAIPLGQDLHTSKTYIKVEPGDIFQLIASDNQGDLVAMYDGQPGVFMASAFPGASFKLKFEHRTDNLF